MNRRSFFQRCATLAATIALAPELAFGEPLKLASQTVAFSGPRKIHITGDIRQLAKVDDTYSCVMQVPVQGSELDLDDLFDQIYKIKARRVASGTENQI